MTVQEILTKTTQFFKTKGIASARLDSELIVAKALGWSRVELYLKTDYPVDGNELDRCRDLVRRRATGEPVAYLFGEKEFYGRSFEVNRDVLIPRPETEHLVDEALKLAKSEPLQNLIDLGTGSGCIGLTLLCEIPDSRLLTLDVSDSALQVAKRNAARLELEERVTFLTGDAQHLRFAQVEEALQGPADLIVGNPPYIGEEDPEVDPHVRRFEPSQALFSGDQGLAHFKAWIKASYPLLRDKGWILFEIGRTQGKPALQICEAVGLQNRTVLRDYSGHERILKAQKIEN